MRKRCKICGCYLDPGEWCACDSHPDPERDMVKRPIPHQKTIYPREDAPGRAGRGYQDEPV